MIYTEQEFEQLKYDYSTLNLKHSELLKTCTKLETDNDQLLQNLERIQQEKENTQSFENVIKQYEDYRIKLENNLQKITQQRDTNKMELRLVKEMLTSKENDYNQLKMHCDQYEKHFQNHQEQFRLYENTINDLEKQIQQTRVREYRLIRLIIVLFSRIVKQFIYLKKKNDN